MLGKGVSSARTDVIAAPAISKPNNIDPQRFLMMTPGADDRHGARGSLGDRRGNPPDDRRHGEVAGFAVLAAYSLVVVMVLESLAALLMAMPRVYFAMARDGLFFPAAAALDSRYHTPARAIAIQAIPVSLLAVLGTFDEILAYFTVPTVVFVGLTVAAVFVLGQGARNTEEPVPWHPIPPLLFLVPTAVLLALMAMNKPKHAGIGPAVVLLGLPVYYLVFTRLAPREAPGDASSLAESSPASAAVETT